MMSRLSVERFFGMRSFRSTPPTAPTAIARIFLSIGTVIALTLTFPPDATASESEIATLYATSPTTSSNAMTCNRTSTNSPFAPVCRMVIMVDAGAVAAASAPSTAENPKSSPRMK